MSMALTYEILGSELRTPVEIVVMVSTVVIPKATRADVASWLIQKDTQLNITIKILGKYVWKMK